MRLLLFCLLYIPIGLLAQKVNPTQLQNNQVAIHSECQTPEPNYEDALRRMQKLRPAMEAQRNQRAAAAKIVVRLVVHRLSSSTGLEGPTDATIIAAVDKARTEFSAGDICFSLDYINYVNLDTVLNVTAGTSGPMTSTFFYPNYGDPDRLDVFIFPNEISGISGSALAIPNDHFLIAEARMALTWVTFSHEIGHTLGLYHTHQGESSTCPDINRENINGSNCTTAGDFLCDTPADPRLNINGMMNNNCGFIAAAYPDCNGDTPYTPPVNNIMSYSNQGCRIVFTQDQFDAMRVELLIGTTGPLVGEVAPLTRILTSGSVIGGEHHRTALETIVSDVNATITISNNAKVYHTAGQTIRLQQGVEIKPNNGRYTGVVGDPCN